MMFHYYAPSHVVPRRTFTHKWVRKKKIFFKSLPIVLKCIPIDWKWLKMVYKHVSVGIEHVFDIVIPFYMVIIKSHMS
ncbi:hypothetical protein MTYM_00648 [Methylococcales bacterium]|nr:hypothetical protein MTYM_00648 [Methylococcales bacterium]